MRRCRIHSGDRFMSYDCGKVDDIVYFLMTA